MVLETVEDNLLEHLNDLGSSLNKTSFLVAYSGGLDSSVLLDVLLKLKSKYNLVLILGTRQDLRLLDKQQKDVFQQIFDLVDRYDLYGQVAYPKYHRRDQIPAMYRWVANKCGLFVNPALTEPFGLTY